MIDNFKFPLLGLSCLLFSLNSCGGLISYDIPQIGLRSSPYLIHNDGQPIDLIVIPELFDPLNSSLPVEPGIDQYTFYAQTPLSGIKISFINPVVKLWERAQGTITATTDVPAGNYQITIFAQRTKGRLLEKKFIITVVN